MTKQALLVVSHGSRRPQSNAEVVRLTEKMQPLLGQRFISVQAAFLELAEPSIPDGIQAAIDAGAEQVLVLPYFLAAGRHVAEDIPGIVAEFSDKNPQAKVKLIPHLGAADGMAEFLTLLACKELESEK